MVYGETITRQRATGRADRYSGEDTDLDWSTPDEVDIAGVAVEPVSTFETVTTAGDRVDFDLRLYLPYGADVKPLDRVVVRGGTYDVKGERSDWHNPYTGAEPGSVVLCKRVKGG
jgi:hypothetical protein